MHFRRAKKSLTLARDDSGAVAVFVALILVALCGFMALAFDIGHMVMVKSELQRTADAAALAGATGLVPYVNPGPNQTPNWAQGVSKAHTMINNAANLADGQTFSITDGTVQYGYWYLKPPADYVQPKPPPDAALPVAGPFTPAYLAEPAIVVTLTKTVNLYLAPVVGVSSPKTVSATATAILPEAYTTTSIPPVAVSTDLVYNYIGNTMVIDITEQDVKIQSNKGNASWFNLDGSNSVPSVRINTPITSCSTPIYLVPGAKATLTEFIKQGDTIVIPVVDDITKKTSQTISDWAAFKVDVLSANSMEGHFLNQYYDPNVVPSAGAGLISAVAGTPKLVGQ